MIYPTITISPDQSTIINIYDTEFDSSPVMSIQETSQNALESFYTLLTLFLNQYVTGFERELLPIGFWFTISTCLTSFQSPSKPPNSPGISATSSSFLFNAE